MSKDSQDIQGHLNVSQNTVIGGDLELNGNACIDHDLNVKGWFEARNFRGAMKGQIGRASCRERVLRLV